jgi:hypothetical protein
MFLNDPTNKGTQKEIGQSNFYLMPMGQRAIMTATVQKLAGYFNRGLKH